MNLENYVLDKYLNKIVQMGPDGKKYVLEKDVDALHLNSAEKKFVFQIMEKHNIECRLDVVESYDRPKRVRDFEYGKNIDSNLENRDIPKYAVLEYDENGNLIKEDYTKLDKFIEEEFLPDNVMMKKRREDREKEFVGYIDTKNGKRRKFKRNLYPSVQLNMIVALKLSDREYKHVLEYLDNQGILVRGKDSTIDQEFENYDYYVTYKNEILPKPLSKKECYDKFVEFSKTKDPVLRQQLILENMRLVPYIAWSFALLYERDISEIESYGYEGLINAVDNYDYTLGFSFSSFACSYIRGYILSGEANLDYHTRGEWIGRFYKCKKIIEKERGEKIYENMDLINDVAELMVKDQEAAKGRKLEPVMGLEGPQYSDKIQQKIDNNVERIKFFYSKNLDDYVLDSELDMDEISADMEELIADDDVERDALTGYLHDSIEEAMKCLTPRENMVIRLRFGFTEKGVLSLEETGRILGVCKERVRQIEAKALRKLRHPSRRKKLNDFV